MIFLHNGLHCTLVPVQYREYEFLFRMPSFQKNDSRQGTSWCHTSGHFYCFLNQSKSILQRKLSRTVRFVKLALSGTKTGCRRLNPRDRINTRQKLKWFELHVYCISYLNRHYVQIISSNIMCKHIYCILKIVNIY